MITKKRSVLNVGYSFILVTFILLCLVTFATLSVVSANSDYSLSKKVADKTTSYYEASNEAENTLSQIDNRLKELYSTTSSSDDYYNDIINYLPDINGLVFDENEVKLLNYTTPITDNQSLFVSLTITYPNGQNNNFYTINSWKVINETDFELDNNVNLLNENDFLE